MNPLLAEFITETRELLERVSQGFLVLERNPGDAEALNGLFRGMHTIKGSSGIFEELGSLTRLVHAAEDVLDGVRQGQQQLTPEGADIFFEILDQVATWVDELEASETLGPGAGEASVQLVRRLRQWASGGGGRAEAKPGHEAPRETDALPSQESGENNEGVRELPWAAEVPEALRREWFRAAAEGAGRPVVVTYTPDEACFFAGDDPFHTVRNAPGVAWGTVQAREPWPDLGELDPYRCVLEFRLVCTAPEGEVEEWFRYVADQVRVETVVPSAWVRPTGEPSDPEPFGAFVHDAREWARGGRWENLRRAVGTALGVAGPELLSASALRWLDTVLATSDPDPGLVEWLIECVARGEVPPEGRQGEAGRPSGAGVSAGEPAETGGSGTSPAPLGDGHPDLVAAAVEILEAQRTLLASPVDPGIRRGVLRSVARVAESVLIGVGQTEVAARVSAALKASQTQGGGEPLREVLQDALAPLAAGLAGPEEDEAPSQTPAKKPEGPVPEPGGNGGQKVRVLRVDQARIDALMDLVGELVVAKNALPFLARKAEDVFQVRELAREIKNQHAVINRIAEELQGAVMQVRMVPVSHTFQRFPRLVRDLSRKLGKKVRLLMEGEETEADKNVVEDLTEPLVHLIRNSMDHGIEPPDERLAAGKTEEGEIRLRAVQLDDQVLIEVIDDGRGMDPEHLKRKAYEKGILSEERLDTITDQEALHLIFAPGFSTAPQVSNVSGRGVGMDAVRAMVDRVGGSVAVESEPGRGTCIRLSLPLSMAVTRVMIVEVGGQMLGVPIESVVETVRVPADGIHRIKGRETVVLRDRLVPLCRLGRVLALGRETADGRDEEAVLVVQVGGNELGLVVDRFHEGVDIILKPLEGILAGFRLYAGTALLGDGRVLLVLNLRELVACL